MFSQLNAQPVLSEDQALCHVSDKKEMIRQFVFSVEGLVMLQAALVCGLLMLGHNQAYYGIQ